jgi:hypothetical protein
MRTVFPNRTALSMRGRRAPNPTEPCAVLAAVKTASRRYRDGCYAASLDRHCARHASTEAGRDGETAAPAEQAD